AAAEGLKPGTRVYFGRRGWLPPPLSSLYHAVLPARDHGRDHHAGLLLRVHGHLQRARAGLLLLRQHLHQALPGPEDSSAVPPVLLYALVAGLPTLLITVTETALFLIQYTSKEFDRSDKTVATGDCCYLNPLVRRTVRFLGVYVFGLFTVDIFVNAGQVVTGNLAPYFLTVCKPNYTALGCQQALRYISHQEACTGNQDDILRARKSFPSKEAALSVYGALYLAMYVTCVMKSKNTRLASPVLSLGLMCLAFLTGLNRVAEYRNHWADIIAGYIIGTAIATFLVVCVVHNFKGKLLLSDDPPVPEQMPSPIPLHLGRVESPMEKYMSSQNHIAFAEVT
uniref:Phospholipid phosphatase-related protein type 5 n=1 Tax=Neogobius melanostomus TaxID=47308 RepID=A0A8C6UE83_9GOBI